MTMTVANPANQIIESVYFNGQNNTPNNNSTATELFFTILPPTTGGVIVTIDDIRSITYQLRNVSTVAIFANPLSITYNIFYRAPIGIGSSFSKPIVEPGEQFTLAIQFTNPDNAEVTGAVFNGG